MENLTETDTDKIQQFNSLKEQEPSKDIGIEYSEPDIVKKHGFMLIIGKRNKGKMDNAINLIRPRSPDFSNAKSPIGLLGL